MITGNPVRSNIAHSRVSHEEGLAAFGLDNAKKAILVVGGSLGAKTINEAIAKGIEEIAGWKVQLIWQTGKLFLQEAKSAAEKNLAEGGIVVQGFIRNMEYAYAAAEYRSIKGRGISQCRALYCR